MKRAWFTYVIICFLFPSYYMVAGETRVLFGFVLVLIVPLLALGMHFLIPIKVTPEIENLHQGKKGETCKVGVNIKNMGYLPYGRITGRLTLRNLLTREVQNFSIKGALSPRGEKELLLKLKSEHGGKIQMSLSEIKIYDLFCLSYRRVKKEALSSMLILPNFMQSNPLLFSQGHEKEDLCQTEYDDQIKGGDYSEIFQYRGYERGDSLHRIHWKLSGKLGELVVKEGSKPVPRSILLLFSTSVSDEDNLSSPKKRDTLFETLLAVSQGLLLQGIPHGIAFQDQQEKIFVHTLLEYEEDLSSFLPQILSAGEGQDKKGALDHYQDHIEELHYDHVILITSEVPKEVLFAGKLSVLLIQENKEIAPLIENLSIQIIPMEDLESSLMGLTL